MKKFLRSIILFPLSILMGNLEGAATTTEAGAVAATPVAEQGSTQEVTAATTDTTGAVPDAGAAELQGGENAEVTEADATATGGIRQTTFEQRVNELVEKKTAELEQRLTARETAAVAEKPDFINLDFTAVNRHLAGLVARERELQDEIAVDPANADPALLDELFNLQTERETIRKEVRENEQKKADFLEKSKAQQQNEQQREQMNARIAEAAEMIRSDANIPPDVWKKGQDFFEAERAAKPLLDAQYREKVMLQGPIAGLLWAKEYCEKNMGKTQQDLINQKEAAKATLPPGKTATGVVVGSPTLDALKAAATASPTADNLAAYSKAKREAASAQQQ
jgi:hypothetical protein